jgi:hypothetical protein
VEMRSSRRSPGELSRPPTPLYIIGSIILHSLTARASTPLTAQVGAEESTLPSIKAARATRTR